MRVCMVCHRVPPDYTGAGLATLRLASRLLRRGCRCIVVAQEPVVREGGEASRWEEGVEIIRVGGGGRMKVRTKRPSMSSLMGLAHVLWLRRGEMDIVHCHGVNVFALVAAMMGKALGKKVVLTLSMQGEAELLGRAVRFERILLDGIVSKSPALTAEWRRRGVDQARLFEIPNGVDVRRFVPVGADEKRGIRRRLGLDEDRHVIVYVGGINRRKRVGLLCEMLRLLWMEGRETTLVLVGPVEKYGRQYVEQLRGDLRDWGLGEAVHWTGRRIQNVWEYLQAGDVFVLASEREGFPSSVVEAMACGLPVVAMGLNEVLAEALEEDVTGFRVKDGDVAAMAIHVMRLLDQEGLRTRIGRAARARVLEKFDGERIADSYVKVYAKLGAKDWGTSWGQSGSPA